MANSGAKALTELYERDPAGTKRALDDCHKRLQNNAAVLGERLFTDIAEWQECPLCGGAFSERVESAVQCNACEAQYGSPNYFTSPNTAPVVSTEKASYGRLEGAVRAMTGLAFNEITEGDPVAMSISKGCCLVYSLNREDYGATKGQPVSLNMGIMQNAWAAHRNGGL